MLTDHQIEYCLAKIREQLTSYDGRLCRPNVDGIIQVLKRTIAEAYGDTNSLDDNDSIFTLGLQERTAQILFRAGYETVYAVKQATPKELLGAKQFGDMMLCELRETLGLRGCTMRGDFGDIELRKIRNEKKRISALRIKQTKATK